MRTLGVDCGEVILYTWGGVVPGSFEYLRKIAESGKFQKIYIISKTRSWFHVVFLFRLWVLDFWNYTGIPRKNIYFCKQWKQKSAICEKLGVTDFVDDRFEVLHHLYKGERGYAFNPDRTWQRKKYRDMTKNVTIVRSWEELGPVLLD